MNRRSFIRSAAGLFVAAAAAPIVEPVERVRRWWQVGARLERPALTGAAVAMQLEQERALRVGRGLFGIDGSRYPDSWVGATEPLTWEKLQADIETALARGLPKEPPRYYLTPQEFELWRELAEDDHPAHTDSEYWARGPLNRWEETVITKAAPGTYLRESLAGIRKLGAAPT